MEGSLGSRFRLLAAGSAAGSWASCDGAGSPLAVEAMVAGAAWLVAWSLGRASGVGLYGSSGWEDALSCQARGCWLLAGEEASKQAEEMWVALAVTSEFVCLLASNTY